LVMAATYTPAPVALPALLTSRRPNVQLWPKLPEAYPAPICIRNTFIDACEELSPSLAGLYHEREVQTCPSAHIGRFHGLFHELDDAETRLPSESPAALSTPDVSPSSAAMPPACVISLAGLVSPPSQPTPAGGQLIHAGGAINTACLGGAGDVRRGACRGERAAWSEVLLPRGVSAGGSIPEAVLAPPQHPAPGSAEVPSVGSVGHASGRCKPCVFFHAVEGCTNGFTCQFCHLCDADEKKRRRKAKLEARRADKVRRAGKAVGRQERA